MPSANLNGCVFICVLNLRLQFVEYWQVCE